MVGQLYQLYQLLTSDRVYFLIQDRSYTTKGEVFGVLIKYYISLDLFHHFLLNHDM